MKKLTPLLLIYTIFLSFSLVFLFPKPTFAQLKPIMVKDINDMGGDSNSTNFVKANDIVYFTADDGFHGLEYWKTDGTPEGTTMIKDIREGTGPSTLSPSTYMVAYGSSVYFRANDGINGIELWKSDGTETGTVMVKDIYSGSSSSSPTNLIMVGDTLYFRATNGINGIELWKSDGTEAGTVMVKDIYAGAGSSMTGYTNFPFAAIGDTLLFVASTSTTGIELWKSDGTEAGTVMVKDIYIGSSSSTAPTYTYGKFIVINDILYFPANNGINGYELWRSDSTEAGTYMVKDIYSGSSGSTPSTFYPMDGVLYFKATDGVNGYELWKSEGTEATTLMVKDISTAADSYFNYPYAIGNTLYFSASDNISGYELWKTDGTEAGTVMVKDIWNGADASSPSNMTELNGTLYFSANDGIHGGELWTSDGTQAGTVMVKDIFDGTNGSYPGLLLTFGSSFLFTAEDFINGEELWISDGTLAGTQLVKNIYTGTRYSSLNGFLLTDTLMFFLADDSIHGVELWRSDGTQGGTNLVKDIYEGEDSSGATDFYSMGNIAYFRAEDDTHGEELWRSDGTEAGTYMVKDIYTGLSDGFPYDFNSIGTTLFFQAHDATYGRELWKTDGTEAGTVIVKDINIGSGSAQMDEFTISGSILYFTATDEVNGTELWRSNGTETGTYMVKDIRSGSQSSYPSDLTTNGEIIYFSANDGVNGTELWRSDGTDAGTYMVKNIYAAASSSYPDDFLFIGDIIYFSANNGTNGYELWRSDGTDAGTYLIKDINPGSANGYPTYFISDLNTLYFMSSDGVHGDELWRSDGTEAGTYMVKDIYPGATGNYTWTYFLDNHNLYFQAEDGTNGVELWKSDGTEAGTVLLKDINPGVGDGDPEEFILLGDSIYFRAEDITHGSELWVTDGTEAGTYMVEDLYVGDSDAYPYQFVIFDEKLFFIAYTIDGSELWTMGEASSIPSDPPTGTLSINLGNSYTSSQTVTINLTASEQYQMIICNNQDFTGCSWESFSSTKSWTLLPVEGNKTVYAKFKNSSEQESTIYSSSILLDTTAPTGNILINLGQSSTNNKIVTLNIYSTDALSGISQMSICDNPSFTNCNWEPYSTSKSWIVSDDSGLKQVYVKFKDNAGVVSGVFYDTIYLQIYSPLPEEDPLNTTEPIEDIIEPQEEKIPEKVTEKDIRDDDTQEDDVLNQRSLDVSKFFQNIITSIQNIEISEQLSKDIALISLASIAISQIISIGLGSTSTVAYAIRFFSFIFGIFRIGKKKRNCGLVYNSVTKEPLNNAMIRIFNQENKLVSTEVTNKFGIFESYLERGIYKIGVNMNGFTFPSKLITTNQDLPYKDIYRGGDFNINPSSLSYSIPIDPIDKSVVDEFKTIIRNRLISLLSVLMNLLILIGFIFSIIAYIKSDTILNLLVVILYLIFIIIILITQNQVMYKFGKVKNSNNEIKENVQIGLQELEFETLFAKRITDKKGKYRFITPSGKYKLISIDPYYDIVPNQNLVFEEKKEKVMVISSNIIVQKRT